MSLVVKVMLLMIISVWFAPYVLGCPHNISAIGINEKNEILWRVCAELKDKNVIFEMPDVSCTRRILVVQNSILLRSYESKGWSK